MLPDAWYRNKANPIIPQKYFMPRPRDTDGISVNRASLTDEIKASTRPDNGERIPMAKFAVADVHRIGLTVLPKPLPNDRSHAVIPELKSEDRQDTEKEKMMEQWAMELRNCSTLIRPS
ncbi:MAG: hypothetical protein ACP5O1_09050 [Phycisphaerae bacterium]